MAKLVIAGQVHHNNLPPLWIPNPTPHKRRLNVLVACERSGTVRDQFILLGHNAWSVDLEKPTTKSRFNNFHIRADIFQIINSHDCPHGLYAGLPKFDLMIGHPPCTYLSVSGNSHFLTDPTRYAKRDQALAFFRDLLYAPIPYICLENPRSQASKVKKPDQLIQPYHHGEPHQKETFLWLKNLPLLRPTQIVEPQGNFVNDTSNCRSRATIRSKTFLGIAKAIAEQYGRYVSERN